MSEVVGADASMPEALTTALLDATLDALVVVDDTGTIVFVNARAQVMFIHEGPGVVRGLA